MKSMLRNGLMMAAANDGYLSKEDAKVIHEATKDIHAALPRLLDYGTPPEIFGRLYAGSSLKRKNDIRRKHNAKYV